MTHLNDRQLEFLHGAYLKCEKTRGHNARHAGWLRQNKIKVLEAIGTWQAVRIFKRTSVVFFTNVGRCAPFLTKYIPFFFSEKSVWRHADSKVWRHAVIWGGGRSIKISGFLVWDIKKSSKKVQKTKDFKGILIFAGYANLLISQHPIFRRTILLVCWSTGRAWPASEYGMFRIKIPKISDLKWYKICF